MLFSTIRRRKPSRPRETVGYYVGGLSILSVVSLFIGTYLLPKPVRRSLAFEYADPTLATAYTAHLVHLTPSHLFGNLIAFVVVSGLLLTLTVRANDRWLSVGILVMFAFVLPVTLSFLNLAVPRNSVTYGFSGLNMGLVGILPIAAVRYVEQKRRNPVTAPVLLIQFLLSSIYISIVSIPPSKLSRIVFVTSVVLGAVVMFRTNSWRGRRVGDIGRRSAGSDERIDRTGWLTPLFVGGLGVWMLLLSAGFPDEVGVDGTVINIYAHFLGYTLGFISAYLAHEWRLFGEHIRRPERAEVVRNQSPSNRTRK